MANDNLVSQIIDPGGMCVRYTWIPSGDDSMLKPFRQVYGIIFNDKDEVLVIEEEGQWKIPGGTPENGESPEETLVREIQEEADVTLKNIKLIGAQKVEFRKYSNPNTSEGDRFYQIRYIADVDELNPQTPDPDGGETHPRKFVKFEELNELHGWGKTGQAMFDEALKIHNK